MWNREVTHRHDAGLMGVQHLRDPEGRPVEADQYQHIGPRLIHPQTQPGRARQAGSRLQPVGQTQRGGDVRHLIEDATRQHRASRRSGGRHQLAQHLPHEIAVDHQW